MTKILTGFSFSTPFPSPFSSQSYQRSIAASSSAGNFSPKSTAPIFLPPPACPPTVTSSLCPFRAAPVPASVFSLTRSEEHTSELQSRGHLVCRLLLEKKNLLHHSILCHQEALPRT